MLNLRKVILNLNLIDLNIKKELVVDEGGESPIIYDL